MLAEFLAAPFPLYQLDHPPIYDDLRRQPAGGGVLELPFGFADGFGEYGVLDRSVLYYQTIHEKPLLGGFVARMPDAARRQYLDNPLFQTLLSLSRDGSGPPSPELTDKKRVAGWLSELSVGYIVVNRRTAPGPLQAYIRDSLPLAPIAEAEDRALYRCCR